jgi:hypothetical protein
MVQVILGILALLDALISSALGWRYVLSPKYRSTVHARWRVRGRMSVAGEVAWHLFWFVITNAILVVFLIYVYETFTWLYEGIIGPRIRNGG